MRKKKLETCQFCVDASAETEKSFKQTDSHLMIKCECLDIFN